MPRAGRWCQILQCGQVCADLWNIQRSPLPCHELSKSAQIRFIIFDRMTRFVRGTQIPEKVIDQRF